MKSSPRHILALAIVVLCFSATDTWAGLIEVFGAETGGGVTLSIEGNALRLTDNTGGIGALRVFSTPGSGATAADDLGLAGEWPTLTVVGLPLLEEGGPLLPSTRLDSLLGGAGISSSGNSLKEITIIVGDGAGYLIDIDPAEVIGGPIPEPASIVLSAVLATVFMVRRPI